MQEYLVVEIERATPRAKYMGKFMENMSSRTLKYVISLLFTIVTFGIGLLLWNFFTAGYYSSFDVTYGKHDRPLITGELQGKTCTLGLSIGSRFTLFLPKETLDTVDKQPQGVGKWCGISGSKHEASSYLIPKLKVGNLKLNNILAYESNDEDYGILGGFLGEKFNLLVDFSHDRVIACDTFSKLESKKHADKNWIPVPFEMHQGGIVLQVDTDFGPRKFVLSTGFMITYLRSSLIPSNNPFPFISSRLVFSGQQFGNITFEPIELPEGLDEIDGFIGMDFLKRHAVYLDYVHKIAYIEPPRKYFERIPVAFSKHNDPIIDVSVEGNVYPAYLDLGSSFPFAFREEILQNIGKFEYGTASWYDFRGKKYEAPTYTIPEIKINNLKFDHVFTKLDKDDFHIGVTLDGLPQQPLGVIGLPILEKYNLFLDFAHSAIFASSDHLLLQQAGLLSQNLLTIPFPLHPDGILLSVETDMGTYRLMLDTGSTFTAIRSPHSPSTKHFSIMGYDFGQRVIKTLDVSSQFDFDGFLGMDFLCEYPLFIDYLNKRIFIDLQKDGLTTDNTEVDPEKWTG